LLQADNVTVEYGRRGRGRPGAEAPGTHKDDPLGTQQDRRLGTHKDDPLGTHEDDRPALPAGIHRLQLTIPTGSLFGILGPNGSGKTTLLRVLAGILPPAAGRVFIDQVDLATLSRRAAARRMAVVPQETHLAFDYSVLEIALMGRYPHLGTFGLEGPGDVRIARDALAATGTLALERRSFSTLSGGEKQRVVIASALAQSPEIMLLDEPTASLDLGYQLEIAALLRSLNEQRAVTIVVATHDLNFAASVCSHLALLRGGRVMATGSAESVLTRESIAALYGVDADVGRHPATGRLVVVPLRKVS
jgi:iron complex transport system ATP-binding protein